SLEVEVAWCGCGNACIAPEPGPKPPWGFDLCTMADVRHTIQHTHRRSSYRTGRHLRDQSCWLSCTCLVRHQQRHRKMRQELGYPQRGLVIVYSEDHWLTRQHIAPLPVRIDTRHQESGILPHGVAEPGFGDLPA